jgi:hypothetical protein
MQVIESLEISTSFLPVASIQTCLWQFQMHHLITNPINTV